MAYMIYVEDEKIASRPSFNEAKRIAKARGGKVHRLVQGKLPKACSVSNNPATAKREVIREINSETNHGYHVIGRRR